MKVILLARTDKQRAEYESVSKPSLILPRKALDGANLIAASDLVISAGGTINREAAALGVPAATIYAGEWAAIDEELLREGRLHRIATREDVELIPIEKKCGASPRLATHVRECAWSRDIDNHAGDVSTRYCQSFCYILSSHFDRRYGITAGHPGKLDAMTRAMKLRSKCSVWIDNNRHMALVGIKR